MLRGEQRGGREMTIWTTIKSLQGSNICQGSGNVKRLEARVKGYVRYAAPPSSYSEYGTQPRKAC